MGGAGGDIDRISRDLGHQVAHWQTAAVLWLDDNDDPTTTSSALSDLTAAFARALDAPPPLTLVAGSRELWLWAATARRPDPGRIEDVATVLAEAGAHLAVGMPARGLAGFRSSHLEARAVERLGLAARRSPALLSYPDVELLCLVADAPELVHRMVGRELGDLASPDRNVALVRETVLAHLEGGLNVEATAERMFVHKNTIRYRLARAEELLGHPLAERVALLELALRHVVLHGLPEESSTQA
ncbi:PucR family transcriptional regulator [Nocardioides sambongensis]|uniref:PucR family transcriptional regulator n=1 Tax=Nocardioides sambongensis TaxID=2589074 RepID=UPI00112B59C7|nr:helix-turn-helix domain-containing protein [Nocardioides sambongensis]